MFESLRLEWEYFKFRVKNKRTFVNNKIVQQVSFLKFDENLLKSEWSNIPSMKINYKKKIKVAKKLGCKVGRCTYVGNNVYVWSKETVIGNFCSIANNVNIGPSEHEINYLSSSSFFYLDLLGWNYGKREILIKPCFIGNDVWIGDGVFIKGGISIGDGAVIGAGAIVTKDVPPYAVMGGVPAKIIKYRFKQSVIDFLLDTEWWNFSDNEIRTITFDNIEVACRQIRRIRDLRKEKNG